MQRIRTFIGADPIPGTLHSGQTWVPAFAGMTGFKREVASTTV